MLPVESNRLEYKVELTDSLEKEVVAFLNYKEGGIIYIGVDNNRSVVGVDNCDDVQLRIKDRLINNVRPNIMGLFDVCCEQIDGKNVIKIVLASGTEKPYYIKNKGMSEVGCFIRIGSAAQPMTTRMIEDLFKRRVHNSISDISSRYQDLIFNQLKIYYDSKNKTLTDNFAKNLDLLTPDEKYNYIAYLLADKNNISVRYAQYWDDTKVNLRQFNEYGFCSLVKAIYSVLEKLEVENVTFARLTGAPAREERRLVDKDALREVVVNAFVHNDYINLDTPLIEQFSDRFVITSYGGLIDGLTQDDFFNGISKPRNRELMRIFRDVELVEHLGSGMKRIMKFCDKSNFEFLDNFLRVTIPFNKEFESPKVESSGQSSEESSGQSSEETIKRILKLIADNPKVTAKKIAELVQLTDRAVEKHIKQLRESKIIKRVGSTKAGHWEIIKK